MFSRRSVLPLLLFQVGRNLPNNLKTPKTTCVLEANNLQHDQTSVTFTVLSRQLSPKPNYTRYMNMQGALIACLQGKIGIPPPHICK